MVSSFAVDGDNNQDANILPGCSNTLIKLNSWWKVDLEISAYVDYITIWLRTDDYGRTQASNYNIYVSDNGECLSGTRCVRQAKVDQVMNATCSGVGQWVVVCGYPYINMSVILCEIEIYGCARGKYGSSCEFDCGHCLNSLCNTDNGHCPGECETSYWGERCDNVCNNTNCGDTQGCEKNTGFCTSCVDGYWEGECMSECPDNCAVNQCVQDVGHCYSCKTGFYGKFCDITCFSSCDARGCRQSDGQCFGCLSGYWGDSCTKTCPDLCDETGCTQSCEVQEDDILGPTEVGGVGAAIGAFVIFAIGFVICTVRRCRKNQNTASDPSHHTYVNDAVRQTQNTYDEYGDNIDISVYETISTE